MKGYRFERLSNENLHNLVSLYQDCFHLKIDKDFLIKKYNTRSFGAQFIGFLAFEETTNACAGYYGVFPMTAQVKGGTMLIAQSGDTMTHPNHQGKGLFTELANDGYTLFKMKDGDKYTSSKVLSDFSFILEEHPYLI